MPPVSPANGVYNRGYLFGSLAGAAAEDRPFGELQNFSFDDSFNLVELFGPSRRTAIGVGVGARTVSGRASHAKIRARQYNLLRGAAVTADASYTTVRASVTDEPLAFDLHFLTPSNGEDVEIRAYRCLSPSLSMPFASDNWTIPEFGFNVYGDSSGKLFDMTLPGVQTTS